VVIKMVFEELVNDDDNSLCNTCFLGRMATPTSGSCTCVDVSWCVSNGSREGHDSQHVVPTQFSLSSDVYDKTMCMIKVRPCTLQQFSWQHRLAYFLWYSLLESLFSRSKC
jgi:hypothetical protein